MLLGIVGDDALYRQLTAQGTPSPVFVVPLAGGTPEKLWELGATDNQAVSGLVIGHWSAIANGLGNLEVWTRAAGKKPGIATNSRVGIIRGSADGSRIAFSQDAVLSGTKVVSTAIGIRGINDATNIATLSGADGQVNLASAQCQPQFSFAGQTFFAEYCLGVATTQNLGRLVALPAGSTTIKRIDAADQAAASTLAANVRFSTSADGSKVVAASLGGSTNIGKVYTVANPGTGIVDLEGFPNTVAGGLYTMTPDGTHVIYRMANPLSGPGDLRAAVVTSAPATVKSLASGVLTLASLSLDGHSLMFTKLPRDAATNLLDVNVVDFSVTTPTPTAIIAEAKGLPLGFTGTSTQAIYLDGTGLPATPAKLKSVPVAGGASRDLVTSNDPVGGRAATTGNAFVFFTDVKPAASGSGIPTTVTINYVDALTPQPPKKISAGVPLDQNDTEFFVSGKKVAYTRLTIPGGPTEDEGIWTITLP